MTHDTQMLFEYRGIPFPHIATRSFLPSRSAVVAISRPFVSVADRLDCLDLDDLRSAGHDTAFPCIAEQEG